MKHRGHLLTWTQTTVAVDGQPVAAEVAVVPGNGHGHTKCHAGPAIKMRGSQAWGGDVIVRFEDGSYLVLCPWRKDELAKALAPAAELHQVLGAQALGAGGGGGSAATIAQVHAHGAVSAGDVVGEPVETPPPAAGKDTKPGGS